MRATSSTGAMRDRIAQPYQPFHHTVAVRSDVQSHSPRSSSLRAITSAAASQLPDGYALEDFRELRMGTSW
jgi:hypothetical protein